MSAQKPPSSKGNKPRSIKSLRLDIKKATEGHIAALLPAGFRSQECGKTYPLPTTMADLQKLSAILVSPNKKDAGSIYIRRAMKEWKTMNATSQSAIYDLSSRKEMIRRESEDFEAQMKNYQESAKRSLEGVQKEVDQASANLQDLFAMGRKGLKDQMEAHLAGKEWQGEKITAKAFRECYSMVSGTVKALGIPSDQKNAAQKAIFEEIAEAIKKSREVLNLGPGNDSDTEH